MPRCWIAIGVVGFVLLPTRPVCAQAIDDPGSDRRGLYARIGGGAGYSSGEYRFSGMTDPFYGPVTQLTFETTLHGAHGELTGAIGHALARGLAVAGSGGVRIVPVPSSELLGETALATTVMANLGVLIDFFPFPLDESHFVGGAGWAAGTFAYGQNSHAIRDNIVEPEAVSGPHVQAGAGYRIAARFDLLVSGSYAWLQNAHSGYRPLGVTVLASWVHF